MTCNLCNRAIRFWQRSQFVPSIESPNLWTCSGMAHCLCVRVYSDGFSDGVASVTPPKKSKK